MISRDVASFPLLLALAACPFDVPVASEPPSQLPPVPFPFAPANACNEDGWCFEEPSTPGWGLLDVDGSGDDDIWAVGAEGLVAHSDGRDWQFGVQGTTDFDHVHVAARGNVFFSGWNYDPAPFSFERSTIAYELKDGLVSELTIDGHTPERFFSASEDCIWALVPDANDGNGGPGAIYVFRDGVWTRDLETADAYAGTFHGVARAPDDAYLAGFGPFLPSRGLWHFDGTSWQDIWPTLLATADVTDDPNDAPLGASVGSDGSLFLTGAPWNGYVLRQTPNGQWHAWHFPLESYITFVDIAAIDEDQALFLDGSGQVYELAGDEWVTTFTRPVPAVTGLYATADTALLIDVSGAVIKKRGGGWAAERGRLNAGDFFDVWAPPDGEPWAVGIDDQFFHRDDGAWRDVGVAGTFTHVFGGAADDVWVTSNDAGLHFDGTTWSAVEVRGAGAITEDGSVWFGTCGLEHQRPDGSVVAIDADPAVVEEYFDTGCRPWVSQVHAGADVELFVLGGGPGTLYRVDTTTGEWSVVHTDVYSAAYDGRNLWLSTNDARVLRRELDGSFAETAPLPAKDVIVPRGARFMLRAFGEGHLFAYGFGNYLAEHKDGAWTLDTSLSNGVEAVWFDGDALVVASKFGAILRKVLP